MVKLLKNKNIFLQGVRYDLEDIYKLIQANGGFNSNNIKEERHRVRGALSTLKKSSRINHSGYAEYILN